MKNPKEEMGGFDERKVLCLIRCGCEIRCIVGWGVAAGLPRSTPTKIKRCLGYIFLVQGPGFLCRARPAGAKSEVVDLQPGMPGVFGTG